LRLAGRNDVHRFEVPIDIDAQVGPLFAFELRGNLLGTFGQIADVTNAGLDLELLSQEAADRARFCRRFADHQGLAVACGFFRHTAKYFLQDTPEALRPDARLPPSRKSAALSRRPSQQGPGRAGENSRSVSYLYFELSHLIPAELQHPAASPQ